MSIERETELSNVGTLLWVPYRDDDEEGNNNNDLILYRRVNRCRRLCRGRVVLLVLVFVAVSSIIGFFSSRRATGGGASDGRSDLSEDEWDLDTSRKPAILQGEFRPGVTFVQEAEVSTTILASIGGEEQTGEETTTKTESEITIENLSDGGQKIEIVYTHLATKEISTILGGENLVYDSENPVFKKRFEDMKQSLLDNKFTIYVDQDGYVVEDSGHEAVMGVRITNNGVGDWQSQSAKQIQQMRSLAKSLPDDPKNPGDNWEFKVDLDQNTFTGTANLLGYMNYGGSDVAVVEMEGAMDMDRQVTEGRDGNLKEAFLEQTTVKDGRTKIVMFWDNKEKFFRSVTMNISTTIETNLLGTITSYPMEVKTKINTRTKK